MNKIAAITTVTLIALGLGSAGTNAELKGDTMNNQEQIRSILDRYETALNASDVDAVLALYAADGVFMPTIAPTAGAQLHCVRPMSTSSARSSSTSHSPSTKSS